MVNFLIQVTNDDVHIDVSPSSCLCSLAAPGVDPGAEAGRGRCPEARQSCRGTQHCESLCFYSLVDLSFYFLYLYYLFICLFRLTTHFILPNGIAFTP